MSDISVANTEFMWDDDRTVSISSDIIQSSLFPTPRRHEDEDIYPRLLLSARFNPGREEEGPSPTSPSYSLHSSHEAEDYMMEGSSMEEQVDNLEYEPCSPIYSPITTQDGTPPTSPSYSPVPSNHESENADTSQEIDMVQHGEYTPPTTPTYPPEISERDPNSPYFSPTNDMSYQGEEYNSSISQSYIPVNFESHHKYDRERAFQQFELEYERAQTPPKAKLSLHYFPAEIRKMIFEFALRNSFDGTTPALLVALRGDQHLYQEAMPVFEANNYYCLGPNVNEVKTMPPHVLRRIKNVQIFPYDSSWQDVKLFFDLLQPRPVHEGFKVQVIYPIACKPHRRALTRTIIKYISFANIKRLTFFFRTEDGRYTFGAGRSWDINYTQLFLRNSLTADSSSFDLRPKIHRFSWVARKGQALKWIDGFESEVKNKTN